MDPKPHPTGEYLGPFQLSLLILSLVVLGLLVAEAFLTVPPEIALVLQIVDTMVCAVFFLDFVVRFRAAPSKTAFMKWGWIDLIASIPVIDQLRWARAVRVFRVLRLLRGLRSLRRLLALHFAHRTRGGVASVGLVSFLVVTFASVGILYCERVPGANILTAGDAIWWCMSTITTVGYGDKYPVTTAGRCLAVGVMIVGVGLFGTLSGIIASAFLGESEKKIESGEDQILLEIRALRAEVATLRTDTHRSPSPPPGSRPS